MTSGLATNGRSWWIGLEGPLYPQKRTSGTIGRYVCNANATHSPATVATRRDGVVGVGSLGGANSWPTPRCKFLHRSIRVEHR